MLNSGHNLSPTTHYIQLVKGYHEDAGQCSGDARAKTVNPPVSTGFVPFVRLVLPDVVPQERRERHSSPG
jgi:hypothetical protein